MDILINFDQDGRFDRWVRLKNGANMSVRGEVYDQKTQQKILLFTHEKEVRLSKESTDQLGYKLGYEIAEAIVRDKFDR